ncbi:MAG: IclR family transcriptional regulator [Alphaproteobacteria bacterium]|nr:IclR family transcriptional regulator [Alphaproteobacteria bacterium]
MNKRSAGDSLGTVQRVVEIIRFFGERGDATLKELSLALSLAPSTCHRLLELLGRDGFVEQDAAHRRYRIGRELFRIAGLVQSKHDIRAIALPFLRELVEACDETSVLSLYLPADGKMFFAEKVDSSMMLRYQLPMNTPMSVLWGASGRSILAFLNKDEVDRIYAAEDRAPGSGAVLPSRRALNKEIAAIRERGYDITYGQKIAGAVGIGAPVFGIDGKVLGSICVTVPETRIAAKDRPRLGELVRATAAELSAALGAPRYASVKASA